MFRKFQNIFSLDYVNCKGQILPTNKYQNIITCEIRAHIIGNHIIVHLLIKQNMETLKFI